MEQKLTIPFLVIFSTIIFDQLAKALAVKFLPTACNIGFAFGIYQGILNGLIAFLVLLIVIYFFLTSSYSSSLSTSARDKRSREVSSFALLLVIGGGASNIIDRLLRGCVVDFVDIKIWPAFNLADAAITVGAGVLIISLLKTFKKPEV